MNIIVSSCKTQLLLICYVTKLLFKLQFKLDRNSKHVCYVIMLYKVYVKKTPVSQSCTKIDNTCSIFNAITSAKSKPNFLSLKLDVRREYGAVRKKSFRLVPYRSLPENTVRNSAPYFFQNSTVP